MGSNESSASYLRFLADRCAELEEGHSALKSQLDQLSEEEETTTTATEKVEEDCDVTSFPGNFKNGGPYGRVLQSLKHAVHVIRTSSGEIIYWNHAAEKLFGWRDYEVLGHCFWEILVEAQCTPFINRIMEKLRFGHSWSGQFPFKKRSGEVFMALVTKSPLYEDGELVGIVTVSSDASLFNNVNSNQPKKPGVDSRRTQWRQRPQISSVPQMASSLSDLASRVLSGKGDDHIPRNGQGSVSDAEDGNPYQQKDVSRRAGEGRDIQEEESMIAQPAKIAAKLFAKLRKKKSDTNDSSLVENGVLHKNYDEPCWPKGSKVAPSHISTRDVRDSPFNGKRIHVILKENLKPNGLIKAPSNEECHESLEEPKLQPCLPKLGWHMGDDNADVELEKPKAREVEDADVELEKPKAREVEDAAERQVGVKHFPSSGESLASSSSGEPNSMADSDIRWEDLHLGEEIGQGSYAVVYHGLWNGSDVAIKVYFGTDYNEGTLLGYKKEIGIMRKLRHPNVLLFMGACYSQEHLAIVTEFLPRGSLFKILHRNNQILDLRRRLRMALDVARGTNYLHRRNPPIVHRDLKSSNLLVDKNWNVKVGDFGLSKLKNATFLTAKSGGGTPQWMAPEVLRNEPSNEKSDVFSFGIILWELVTVSIPWSNLNALQVVAVVGFMDRRLDLPEDVDPRILSIIKECWQSKPELRPSFQDIIQRLTGILQSTPAAAGSNGRKNSS